MSDPLTLSLFDSDDLTVYVVVDAAKCSKIEEVMTAHSCLLGSDKELQRYAPHFFRLEEKSPLLQWIMQQWGQRNFIIIKSLLDEVKMQQHLSNLLYVHDSEQKPLFFRYYDPRVLESFLSHCTEQQIKAMFEQIECFICEGENGEEYITFRVQNGNISRLSHRM